MALTAALVVLGTVSGCTGGGEDPTPTGSTGATSASATAESRTVQEASQSVLADAQAAVQADAEAVQGSGAVSGTFVDSGVVGSLSVLEAVATDQGTVVRLVLSAPDGSSLGLNDLNDRAPLAIDVRDIQLVDSAAGVRMWPFIGQDPQDSLSSDCGCSEHPGIMDTSGRELSLVYPALDAGTTSVTVQVPGFPDVETDVTRP